MTTNAVATTCGARNRAGGPCGRPQGWGTDHVGSGRCKLHGGCSPIRHGRYSKVKRERLRDLISEYEADPDPLDILPELAAARALFHDFVERYDATTAALLAWYAGPDGEPRPMRVMDIADARGLLSEVTRIAKRIEDVRAAGAISRADFYRLMTEMGRVVDTCVNDPDERDRIRDAWLRIRLA